MKDFLDLVGIEVMAEGPAKHAFVGVFDGPRGQQRLPLPPEAMLDYAAFQRHVLVGTGLLPRHFMAEGIPADSANRIWRNLTDALLNGFWKRALQATPLN